MNAPLLRLAGAAGLAFALCSCASVSVKDISKSSPTEPRQAPKHFYVQTFEVKGAQIKENQFRKNKGQLASESQALLSKYLVEELSRMGIPASVAPAGRVSDPRGWVVSGRFTRVAEGSRILRMGLGLGFGGSKMETQVQVHNDGAPKPFLTFATTGGSNATPGAATNPIPFSAAPTALLDSKEGVTDDSARTARQISATIGEYMVKRGWIDPAKVRKKKEPGSL